MTSSRDMSKLPTLAPRLAGAPPRVVKRPSPREQTEAAWEAKKGLIEQLYIVEGRQLSETMAILGCRHGFAATEQMYKKRLKKWNMRKRIYRTSKAQAPPSPPDDRSDTAENNETKVEEIVRASPAQQSTSLDLVQPGIPASYAGLEDILSSVFSWSQGKLESSKFVVDPMSRYLANPNEPPIHDSRTMYRTFELVFELWHHGKGEMAGMAARKGFYALEYVLAEDHPDLVWHILDTIYDMVNKAHLQLLGMFLGYAIALVSKHLPAQHPLYRILKQLETCDYQTYQGRQYICHLLRTAWLRNVELLIAHVGSSTSHHLWLFEQLIWDGRTSLRNHSPLRRLKEVLSQALQNLAANQEVVAPDSAADKMRIEALKLEFTLMDLGDRRQAEELALRLLHDTSTSTRCNARFHAYALKMLARIDEERGNWELAEKNLMCAISNREAAHGANNNLRVIRDMWVLAAHFRHVGREEDAERVTGNAIEGARRYIGGNPALCSSGDGAK